MTDLFCKFVEWIETNKITKREGLVEKTDYYWENPDGTIYASSLGELFDKFKRHWEVIKKMKNTTL